ncbi:MAG: hypothetical protein PHQ27_07230, partial [Victivallales bacterium]|nr:hypothetical protein [Victivallales bacterium]
RSRSGIGTNAMSAMPEERKFICRARAGTDRAVTTLPFRINLLVLLVLENQYQSNRHTVKGETMGKRIGLCLILGMALVMLSGCEMPFGRYRPTPLKKMKKPDPVESYQQLEALFRKYGGHLAGPEDKTVKWKDTQLYRIYEFKHHTVAIFPFNWNEQCFDMFLIAGHLKKYDNLLEDIGFTYGYDEELSCVYFSNETFNLNQFPSSWHIGFGKAFLMMGEPLIDKIKRSSRIEGIKRKIIKKNPDKAVAMSYECINVYSNPEIDISIRAFDGKAFWMQFSVRSVPRLFDYSICHYSLKVIAAGEFKIPVEKPVKSTAVIPDDKK